jgi:predicted GH43/DUF377 family glycosyl hydrolase
LSSLKDSQSDFFGNGIFDWQFGSKVHYKRLYAETAYNEAKYWGDFSKEPVDLATYQLPDWAIGPFKKYEGNPIFGPSKDGWDRGRFGGGVHNGSVLRRDNRFYYVYRGEESLPEGFWEGQVNLPTGVESFDYICDIGVAVSEDGVNFKRLEEYSPFFRKGEDAKYSFEDVCVVKFEDTYYLFCNRWDWKDPENPTRNGVFMATSKDLLHWHKVGLAFPQASEIHRNACVLQNPHNEAVRVNGKFVMYLNNGLVAYSDDLIEWESRKLELYWPGGEGCFALADYAKDRPANIILFTGGHHTGHFYAVGEVLLSKENPEKALEWLPRPVLAAEAKYPWEDCRSIENSEQIISCFRDCIFFTGMTLFDQKWWAYYGGSEVYTCLALAEERK